MLTLEKWGFLFNGELIMKKGYKRTEIGVIPDDWEVKKLGDCLSKNPDYGINAAAVDYTDTLPTYLRITDISDDGNYISKNRVSVNHQLSDLYFLERGDIVFARTGASVGKTYLYNEKDGKLVFAGFLIRIKPNIKILNPAFLKFHTQTKYYWNWVLSNSMRSGQPGLNSNDYKSFQIPLPPLPEQKAIAEVLSDTDNLIQALEKRIAKKHLIKQGAMQKLLTPKENWEVKSYGEIFSFLTTATYSRAELTEADDINYIHYGDVHTKYDFFIDLNSCNLPTIKNEKAKNYPFLKDGDTIMVDASEDYGGVGKSIEVKNIGNKKAIAGLHTFLLRDKNGVFVDGFRGYIHSIKFIKNQFDRLATGLKVYGVSKNNLKTVLIPIPPLSEQTRISTILSDMDAEIETLEKKLAKYKQIKQGLMQNLLTGKIRLV